MPRTFMTPLAEVAAPEKMTSLPRLRPHLNWERDPDQHFFDANRKFEKKIRRIKFLNGNLLERCLAQQMSMIILLSFILMCKLHQVRSFPLQTCANKYLSQGPHFHRSNFKEIGRDDLSIWYPSEVAARARIRKSDFDEVKNGEKFNKDATIPGYIFFQRSGRQVGNGDDKDATNIAKKKNSGYVPSGMSRAEYSALREMEKEKEKKMNYGAWGPRFRQTDRPDGDWMVMPRLWTFGQVDYQNSSNTGDEKNGIQASFCRRIQSLAQNCGPALLLGFFLVDCFSFVYAMWKFRQNQNSVILRETRGLCYIIFRLILSARVPTFFATRKMMKLALIKDVMQDSATMALVQTNALKIVVAMLQIPLWNNLMERTNRRWLWSKSRFAAVTFVALVGFTIFGTVLI